MASLKDKSTVALFRILRHAQENGDALTGKELIRAGFEHPERGHQSLPERLAQVGVFHKRLSFGPRGFEARYYTTPLLRKLLGHVGHIHRLMGSETSLLDRPGFIRTFWALRAAKDNGGSLTMTEAMHASAYTFESAKAMLDDLELLGLVEPRESVNPSGVQVRSWHLTVLANAVLAQFDKMDQVLQEAEPFREEDSWTKPRKKARTRALTA